MSPTNTLLHLCLLGIPAATNIFGELLPVMFRLIITANSAFVSFHLSCTGSEACRECEDAQRGGFSVQKAAASQHMRRVTLSIEDQQALDEQERPVQMSTGTQEFLCGQLERQCTAVSLHCIKGYVFVLCQLLRHCAEAELTCQQVTRCLCLAGHKCFESCVFKAIPTCRLFKLWEALSNLLQQCTRSVSQNLAPSSVPAVTGKAGMTSANSSRDVGVARIRCACRTLCR